MYSPQHAYFETTTAGASPLELTELLYRAAQDAIRQALHHFDSGNIAARSHQISRVMEIVFELRSALDHDRGGQLAARLGALYDYIVGRCLDANLHQRSAPLIEAAALLETLDEGWRELIRMQNSTAD